MKARTDQQHELGLPEDIPRVKISVIIPIYNAEQYLQKSLESLRNQTFQNFEVIMVDDGSTDCTAEICQEFSNIDKRFYTLRQSNQGVSSARNLGLASMQGEYVVFMDADDTLPVDALTIRLNAIEAFQVDCAKTTYSTVRNGKQLESRMRNRPGVYSSESLKNLRLEIATGRIAAYVPTFIFNSEFIKKRNLRFIEGISMMEDTLFLVEALDDSTTLYLSKENTYVYNILNSGATLSINGIGEKIDSVLQVNRLMRPYFNSPEYSGICATHLRVIVSMFLVRFDQQPFSQFLIKELKKVRANPYMRELEVRSSPASLSCYDRFSIRAVLHGSRPTLLFLSIMRRFAGKR